MEIDARLQSIFYLFSRVAYKGALPPELHRAPIERETPQLQSPFQPSLTIPDNEPTPGFPTEPP
jgi:hypothetical protein